MEAIRKRRVKNSNQTITVNLPKYFNPKEVDVIILPSEEESVQAKGIDIDEWRKEIADFYSNFNVDLSNYKFNRDELYDRP
ncbi:MAG: hypothetical protein KA713_08565 [Chryseotalea sp. WA131a]|jgi:hypothetical protein|nr:MAG: hypothetical protein KA713_08565 [Chryseotalea sp. WA131a]